MSIHTAKAVTLALLLGVAACSGKTGGAPSQAMGSTWADAAKMPDLFAGKWLTMEGFVEGDEKTNVPFTPKAQKYVDAYVHKRDIPYASEGCKSPGIPLAMRLGGGLKFTYAPGLISIYMQSVGHTRFIRMNQPMGPTSPKYYGTSVGHWEGDTLVVETNDFSNDIDFQYGVGKPLPLENTIGTVGLGPPPTKLLEALSASIWGPHGENMRMVERMRLTQPDALEIETTIYDDTVWTKPWVTKRVYQRAITGKKILAPGGREIEAEGDPEEFVCTVSITSFDPATNEYVDKSPEEMVKLLDKQGK